MCARRGVRAEQLGALSTMMQPEPKQRHHLQQHRFVAGELCVGSAGERRIEDVQSSGRAKGMFSVNRASLRWTAGLVATCLSTVPAAALDPREQRGFTLAKVDCAKCHAISKVGDSPLREAPPFRTLHQRYPIQDLAESLAEGISTGHPAMPEWRLDPGQIGELIAYLKTLE